MSNRYTRTAIILHWLIALGIFGMLALGWYMTGLPKEAPKQIAYDLFDWGLVTWQLAEGASPRTFYFNLHKSIGITLFALIIFRIFGVLRIVHRHYYLVSKHGSANSPLVHIIYFIC